MPSSSFHGYRIHIYILPVFVSLSLYLCHTNNIMMPFLHICEDINIFYLVYTLTYKQFNQAYLYDTYTYLSAKR